MFYSLSETGEPLPMRASAVYGGACFRETESEDRARTAQSLAGIEERLENARRLIESVRRSFPLLPVHHVSEDAFEEIDGGLDDSVGILKEALACVEHLRDGVGENGTLKNGTGKSDGAKNGAWASSVGENGTFKNDMLTNDAAKSDMCASDMCASYMCDCGVGEGVLEESGVSPPETPDSCHQEREGADRRN